MNKEEYRSQLTMLLHSLPKKEREEAVVFYMEMIADRMDEQISSEEALYADDQELDPRMKMFLRVCWILILVGLGLILLSFMISGFDGDIFSALFVDDKVYLGGVEVTDPQKLLFSPFIWLWR